MSNRNPKQALFRAPAKLNLGLEIVGRRPDGFHELQSLFWPIDLCDEIEIQRNPENISVAAEWAEEGARRQGPLPQNEANLVYRALELAGGGWAAKIRKSIPMGAGLGGGSSDAGQVLAKLVKNIDEKRAAELGADVPFFLNPIPSWVEGIGESRAPLGIPIPDWYFLLIVPPEPLSTPAVFKAYRESGAPFSPRRTIDWFKEGSLKGYLSTAKNDLFHAANRIYPLLASLMEELGKTRPLYASMTGSGSTCFAIYATNEDREKSSKVLQPFLRKTYCTSLFARSF